jgi:hypothetical protein
MVTVFASYVFQQATYVATQSNRTNLRAFRDNDFDRAEKEKKKSIKKE